MTDTEGLIPLFGSSEYWRKVYYLQEGDLIQFLRQNEASGIISYDSSEEGNNGQYTGVDLQNKFTPYGELVPYYDGVNDCNNIYSAALNADFNGSTGSMVIWVKAYDAAAWGGTSRGIFNFTATGFISYASINKHSTANWLWWRYNAGGTVKSAAVDLGATLKWFAAGMTWNKPTDELKLFYKLEDGAFTQFGPTLNGLGVWSGSLIDVYTLIGAGSTTPGNVWHGWIGGAMAWKAALSDAKMEKAMTA